MSTTTALRKRHSDGIGTPGHQYTTGEVAKLFHVSPRSVSKWMDSGKLRCYRIPGTANQQWDRRCTAKDIADFCKRFELPNPLPSRGGAMVLCGCERRLLAERDALRLQSLYSLVAWCARLGKDGNHVIVVDRASFCRRDVIEAGAVVRELLPAARLVVLLTDDEALSVGYEHYDAVLCRRGCERAIEKIIGSI